MKRLEECSKSQGNQNLFYKLLKSFRKIISNETMRIRYEGRFLSEKEDVSLLLIGNNVEYNEALEENERK